MLVSDRNQKAEKGNIERRKRYLNDRHSFAEVYGTTPFIDGKSSYEVNDEKDAKGEPEMTYTEADKLAAQRFAMALFGNTLNEPLPSNSPEILTLLLWWHLGYEETYDFKMPLDDYRDHCGKLSREEVSYWDSKEERRESIIRGTYGVLHDHNEETVLAIMLGAWRHLLQPSPNGYSPNTDPVAFIMKSLVQILDNLPMAFAPGQKSQPAKQGAMTQIQQKKSWQTILVTAASVAISVGLVTGAVLFLRKRWSK
jgi:hypothetical protein